MENCKRPWMGPLGVALGLVLFGLATVHAAESDAGKTPGGVLLQQSQTWTPDPQAAPNTGRDPDDRLTIGGNGTPTCCGGWQFYYTGIRGGQAYRLRTRVSYAGLDHPRDDLVAIVLWDQWKPTDVQSNSKPWNYLIPQPGSADAINFDGAITAPTGATSMTVRYVFRWSEKGKSSWEMPRIEETTIPPRKPVKICVLAATSPHSQRTKIDSYAQGAALPKDVAGSVDRWASLVAAACRRKPQLIVTPELAVSGAGLFQGAVAVPGPATRPFEKLARENRVHLVLSVKERSGKAVYNSAALIGPDGKLIGVYRKVHLATSEGLSGLSAGDSFPVFSTSIGRIGCLICMDTTVSESARMLGLQGADFICFPIMGDLRADRWTPGTPVFNEDRWKAVMRTRALDNQTCMVVARNDVAGACIIDRKGDILAWNEGDQEIIEATLPAADGYRSWDGGEFREITFLLRRPQLYRAYSDESCSGMGPPNR